MKPLFLAALLAAPAAPAWADPCKTGDLSCGKWVPSGNVAGVRWAPNAPGEENAPQLQDPYPDVDPSSTPDSPSGDQPAPRPDQSPAPRELSADERRAKRRALDKLAAEKAREQGVIIENHQDLMNFQLCERGKKSACAKVRHENDGAGSPRGSVSGDGKSRRNADGSVMTEEQAQKADAAATEALAQKAGGAMSRASAAGDAMKVRAADDLPDGPAGGPGGAGGPGAKPADAAGDAPRSLPTEDGLDLAAAAASGFGASFSALGLKMGASGQVLRSDGRPASRAEVSRLRRQIASDPKALMRRPDMFDVISRDRVSRLKNDYRSKPEETERAFKDIALTPGDRDFVHTRSCNPKLEKDCNKLIDKPYRKGDDVTPEDLDVIDDGLNPGDDDYDEGGDEEGGDGAAAARPARSLTAAEIIAADTDERRAARAHRRRLRRLSGGPARVPPEPAAAEKAASPAPSPWPTITLLAGAGAFAVGAWLRRRRAREGDAA